METTEPTLEQIIAAPDPAGELHDARRLLDALVQLLDAFGEGQDPESMVGVAYAVNDKIDAAIAMLETPATATPVEGASAR